MRMSDSLPRSVLSRKAVVYVRQSTPAQVRGNLESQRRQYDLVGTARHHGFSTVECKFLAHLTAIPMGLDRDSYGI